ncbi:uncharacterized protein LOC128555118 isoform X3 [Mercenaria mercenaria]|nr:uncharacterized protein LOC128555118 isoform X3 [Mercenaria mercenaria]
MSCSDMVHVELCDHVEHCSYGEVCFLEKYIQMENEIRFKSGCKLAQDCTQHSGREHCTECCSDDFCNSRGCNETGISGVLSRGPLCYDCSYAASPNECNVISLCNQGQVCSVEEYAWGNYKHFEMECQNNLECATKKRGIGEKRSTLTCKHCCDSDFCNTNCNGTVAGHGVAIVG